MRVRVLHHDHCFDGAASAAFFSRFLREKFHPGAEFMYTGMMHTPNQTWDPALFDGDVNAIVDFKFAAQPRLTWWFDHHQSAFLTPEDAEFYKRTNSPQHYFDPRYRSCTMFIADIAREKYGFRVPELNELVEWADVIDGARYASPHDAVEIKAPATQLVLVIEGAKAPDAVPYIIGQMQTRKLADIAADPIVQAQFQPLFEQHLKSIGLIRSVSRHESGVVFFDLADQGVEGYNKFIPYYLFPDSVYTVSVLSASFRTKISVGSNPWVHNVRHNLATICERYGGGGHPRVGAISLPREAVAEARDVAAEIVRELQS